MTGTCYPACAAAFAALAALTAPSPVSALGGTGASIDETHIAATIRVDPASGSDANNGVSAPVATISRAFQIAGPLLAQEDVKVSLAPGVYREGLHYGPANLFNHVFVLQGDDRDGCILTAADQWTGWSGPDSNGVYSKPWPYHWGAQPDPYGGSLGGTSPELLRYENVTVDGQMYLPRVNYGDLTGGDFYIQEGANGGDGTLFVKPVGGIDLNAGGRDVEVTTRLADPYDGNNHRDASILHVYAAGGNPSARIVLRNLTWQGAAGGFQSGALNLQGVSNCLVDNCRFRLNGDSGGGNSGSDVTYRNCLAENNGSVGFGAAGNNILIQDCVVRSNAIKNSHYPKQFFEEAGFKCGGLTNSTVIRFSAIGNQAKGTWFDTSCLGVVVQDSYFSDNADNGIFWENNNRNNIANLGSQITGLIQNCRLEHNGTGFFTSESENVVLSGCTLAYNSGGQIGMYNGPGRGPINNFAFHDCTLVADAGDETLFGLAAGNITPSWTQQFYPSLRQDATFNTDNNRYYDSQHGSPFPDSSGNQTAWTFGQWQNALSGQGHADQHSALLASNPLRPLTDGVYQWTARHSGKALDVRQSGTGDGTVVQQYTPNGTPAQQWTVTYVGGGYYRLSPGHAPGSALDVQWASPFDGAPVQEYTQNGGSAQQWRLTPTDSGYYWLSPRCSGKALDVSGGAGATGDSLPVQQWTYGAGTNQQWQPGAYAAAPPTALAINAGGGAAGAFVADADVTGGGTYSNGDAIDTSAAGAAPAAVYQSERYGDFTYTIPVNPPAQGSSYTVKLHFAEIYWTNPGQRVFNVSINGSQVLSNFDIVAAAGAKDKAVVETFPGLQPDANGNLTIAFSTVTDNAKVSGIEIASPSPDPTNLTAQ